MKFACSNDMRSKPLGTSYPKKGNYLEFLDNVQNIQNFGGLQKGSRWVSGPFSHEGGSRAHGGDHGGSRSWVPECTRSRAGKSCVLKNHKRFLCIWKEKMPEKFPFFMSHWYLRLRGKPFWAKNRVFAKKGKNKYVDPHWQSLHARRMDRFWCSCWQGWSFEFFLKTKCTVLFFVNSNVFLETRSYDQQSTVEQEKRSEEKDCLEKKCGKNSWALWTILFQKTRFYVEKSQKNAKLFFCGPALVLGQLVDHGCLFGPLE